MSWEALDRGTIRRIKQLWFLHFPKSTSMISSKIFSRNDIGIQMSKFICWAKLYIWLSQLINRSPLIMKSLTHLFRLYSLKHFLGIYLMVLTLLPVVHLSWIIWDFWSHRRRLNGPSQTFNNPNDSILFGSWKWSLNLSTLVFRITQVLRFHQPLCTIKILLIQTFIVYWFVNRVHLWFLLK